MTAQETTMDTRTGDIYESRRARELREEIEGDAVTDLRRALIEQHEALTDADAPCLQPMKLPDADPARVAQDRPKRPVPLRQPAEVQALLPRSRSQTGGPMPAVIEAKAFPASPDEKVEMQLDFLPAASQLVGAAVNGKGQLVAYFRVPDTNRPRRPVHVRTTKYDLPDPSPAMHGRRHPIVGPVEYKGRLVFVVQS